MGGELDVDAVFGASNDSRALFGTRIDRPGAPHRAQSLRTQQSKRALPLPTLPRRPPRAPPRAPEASGARGRGGLAGFAGRSDGSEGAGPVQRGVSSENDVME